MDQQAGVEQRRHAPRHRVGERVKRSGNHEHGQQRNDPDRAVEKGRAGPCTQRGERNRRSRRHVGVDSRRRTMRSEQEARDDKSDGNAQGLHTENGSRRRDRSSDDNGSEDGQHDQRRHESGDPERSQRMKQSGEQAGSQLETAAKREECERDADAGDRRKTRSGEDQQTCEQDNAGDENAPLDPAPQPANRNRQPHGIERCIDEGRVRQDADGGEPGRDGEERQQEIDNEDDGQVGGERGRREDNEREEVDAERDGARRYRQTQRREDARGKGIGQLTRRARQACRVITHSTTAEWDHGRCRATPAGT